MSYRGSEPFSLISTSGVNATLILDEPGNVWSIEASSLDNNPIYLKLYNIDIVPEIGVHTPSKRFVIPAGKSGGETLVFHPPRGVFFSNGIAFVLTTGIADDNTDPVDDNTMIINVDYSRIE